MTSVTPSVLWSHIIVTLLAHGSVFIPCTLPTIYIPENLIYDPVDSFCINFAVTYVCDGMASWAQISCSKEKISPTGTKSQKNQKAETKKVCVRTEPLNVISEL